jgi:hypothetical protein
MLTVYDDMREAAWPSESGVSLQVPASPHHLAGHYDLTISHPPRHMDQYAVFEQWLAEAAATYGLSCALIHQEVVDAAVTRLAAGEMSIGLHLDYETWWNRVDDPFVRLAFAVEDAGGHSINLPARSMTFTDKAAAHHELERCDLGTPPTVLVRPWSGERNLTNHERWHLRLDEPGTRLYIKPANGACGLGVVRLDRPTPERVLAALSEARRFDPSDTYLVQTEIRPPWLRCSDGISRPAYWRVLHCLGELTAFWWQPAEFLAAGERCYREVAAEEVEQHRLQPIFAYVQALAERCGLDWFSTELCLCPFARPGRFTVRDVDGLDLPLVAIDYVNDQCDVDVQSRWPTGLPDGYVRKVAYCFAELAWQLVRRATRAGLCPVSPLRAG